METEKEQGDIQENQQTSCDKSLNRAEFINKVVKGAALTGGVAMAPAILDKFLIPPAYAGNSSGCIIGEVTTAGGPDSVTDGIADGTSGVETFELECNNNANKTPCSVPEILLFVQGSLCGGGT